jgi:hypothetical protein
VIGEELVEEFELRTRNEKDEGEKGDGRRKKAYWKPLTAREAATSGEWVFTRVSCSSCGSEMSSGVVGSLRVRE